MKDVIRTGAVLAVTFPRATCATEKAYISFGNSLSTSVTTAISSEMRGITASDIIETQRRSRQISLLAMRSKPTARSRNSWMNTVGKYAEGSPVDKIFEEGSKLRKDERNEA